MHRLRADDRRGDAAGAALGNDWHWFWRDSIAYQATRPAPFSLWGLWGGYRQTLHLPEHIVLGAAVALGLAAAFLPRGERTHVEVAALGAAIIIGLQMGDHLLVLPLHRLVLPARDRRAGRAHPPEPGSVHPLSGVRWRGRQRVAQRV